MPTATLAHAPLYKASSKRIEVVEVPPMKYLTIDGAGDPNRSVDFQHAIEALYGLSYTLKFRLKKEGKDFKVGPLESLWWTSGQADDGLVNPPASKDELRWTAMIAQPDFLTEEDVAAASIELRIRKNPVALARLHLKTIHEGNCVQVLHVGPYSAETPTINALHEYIATHGLRPKGRHHEIYLGDPKRSAPEKLKTIIRQPVAPAV